QCEILRNDLNVYIQRQFVPYMGVGQTYSGITGIRESFAQAEQALKLESQLKDPKVITFYEDLGIYRLLGKLSGGKEFTDFFNDTIGKLVNYDKSHNLQLVETLKMYFEKNENLKKTSQALFIHVNTLKYRIQKIGSITGCPLNNTDGKMMLYIGLKINEMMK